MAGEQVVTGRVYRAGQAGATVRFADGSERILLPGQRYEFFRPGTVLEGTLSVEGVLGTRRKQRRDYDDKMRRNGEYEDKIG